MNDKCKTKYPILLVHGMGFRDDHFIGYWGRIPKILKSNGAEIFYSGQDANGSIEDNAEQVLFTINKILESTGCDKVNIVAHSKGGLEARYIISTLKQGEKVASLTTLSTCHNGSATMDSIMKFPKTLMKFGCFIADCWFRLLGDKKPSTNKVLWQLTTGHAKQFNKENHDYDGVYYQSFGFKLKRATSDMFLFIPYLVVKHFEGENDGLLHPDSVKWTNFAGVYSGEKRGISHFDEIDMRRSPLKKKKSDDKFVLNDITDLYVDIVSKLKIMGY